MCTVEGSTVLKFKGVQYFVIKCGLEHNLIQLVLINIAVTSTISGNLFRHAVMPLNHEILMQHKLQCIGTTEPGEPNINKDHEDANPAEVFREEEKVSEYDNPSSDHPETVLLHKLLLCVLKEPSIIVILPIVIWIM